MTIRDSLTILDVMYDVQVALTPDGEHLLSAGPPVAVLSDDD